MIQWENRNILKEIKHLSLSFNYWNFCFISISRDDNQVTDVITRNVRKIASTLNYLNNFRAGICDLLAKDQNNTSPYNKKELSKKKKNYVLSCGSHLQG